MRKSLFLAAIAAVVGVAGYFDYNSKASSREFTDTEMENIEALADDEYTISDEIPCSSNAVRNYHASYVDCASCERIVGWESTGTEAICHTLR
jgi:hypothetical protein